MADLARIDMQGRPKWRTVEGCGQECGQCSVPCITASAGVGEPSRVPAGDGDRFLGFTGLIGPFQVASTNWISDRSCVNPARGTLLIAAATVILAVVLAGMKGSVPLVLGTVVAGVAAAALWQIRLDQLARATRAAELEEAEKPYVLPRPASDGGVAQYLRPEEEVVSFWPRPELDELIDWAVSEPHVAVQLVTGQGGTGKTRLARKLADEMTDLGIRPWWVPSGTEQAAVKTARDAGEPALLVVDYAETRTGLHNLLREATSDSNGPAMRVLLLARTPGEWWQQLISNSVAVSTPTGPSVLL